MAKKARIRATRLHNAPDESVTVRVNIVGSGDLPNGQPVPAIVQNSNGVWTIPRHVHDAYMSALHALQQSAAQVITYLHKTGQPVPYPFDGYSAYGDTLLNRSGEHTLPLVPMVMPGLQQAPVKAYPDGTSVADRYAGLAPEVLDNTPTQHIPVVCLHEAYVEGGEQGQCADCGYGGQVKDDAPTGRTVAEEDDDRHVQEMGTEADLATVGTPQSP